MFTKTIKSRVMEVINKRIADVELKYKDGCKQLDEECRAAKETLSDTCVQELIGKII